MGRLVIVVFLAACGWGAWNALRPPEKLPALYETPYVVVYGRDACGYTRQMQRALAKAGIPFHYEVIDEPDVRGVILDRMRRSRIDTSSYMLPVVDVSTKIFVSPEPQEIIAAYAQR